MSKNDRLNQYALMSDTRAFHMIMAMRDEELKKLDEDFRCLVLKRDREDGRRDESTSEFLARNTGDAGDGADASRYHHETSRWETDNAWTQKRRRATASSAPIPIPQPGWTPFGTDPSTVLLAGNAAFQRSCAGKEQPVHIGSPPSAHSKAFQYGLP